MNNDYSVGSGKIYSVTKKYCEGIAISNPI